jgi:hypothetical protein
VARKRPFNGSSWIVQQLRASRYSSSKVDDEKRHLFSSAAMPSEVNHRAFAVALVLI